MDQPRSPNQSSQADGVGADRLLSVKPQILSRVLSIAAGVPVAAIQARLAAGTRVVRAAQTLFGSAKLLLETNEHPGRLKDMVTSPGGTAIMGLHTLEHGGVRATLMNAVEAATRRSRELGAALLKKE